MKKTIRLRYLARLIAIVTIVSITIFFVHRSQNGNQAAACMYQAVSAERKNNYPRMIEYLTRYLRFKPNDLDARERLGVALLVHARSVQNLQDGLLQIEQVVAEDPARRELRKKCVYVAMRLGYYVNAVKHLESLIQNSPGDAELHDLLGQSLAATAQFDKAESEYQTSIELNKKSISTYAHYLSFLKNRNAAEPAAMEELMIKMLTDNEQNPRAYLLSADFWRSRNNVAKQTKDLNTARKLAPKDPEVLLAVGLSELERAERFRQSKQPDERKKELQNARDTFKEGIPTEIPEKSKAAILEGEDSGGFMRNVIGQLYENLISVELQLAALEDAAGRERQFEIAAGHARRAVNDLPEQLGLACKLISVLIDQKKLDDAKSELQKLEDMGFDRPVLEFYRAQILYQENRWLDASQLLEKAARDLVERRNYYHQVQFLLALCYVKLGELDRQYEAFSNARPDDSDPLWLPATEGLAETNAEMGRFREAIELYQKLLPFDPQKYSFRLARLGSSKEIEQLTQKKPETSDALLLAVELLIKRKEFDKARDYLTQSQAKLGQEPGFRVGSALLAAAEGKKDEARKMLAQDEVKDRVEIRLARAGLISAPLNDEDLKELKGLSQPPASYSPADKRQLFTGLARRAEELEIMDLAGNLWDELARLEPDNLSIQFKRFDIAQLQKDEGKLRGIMQEISRIEGPNGTSARSAQCLYLIWKARQGDKKGLEEARTKLQDLIQERQGWTRLQVALAVIYELQGKPGEALEQYKKAVDGGEETAETLQRLAELLYQAERYADALAILRRLPAKVLEQEKMLRISVDVLMKIPDSSPQDRIEALAKAEKLVNVETTGDPALLRWLGRMRWECGHRAQAEPAYRAAVKIDPKSSTYWLPLLRYLVAMDRKKEAEQAFAEARPQIKPDERDLFEGEGYAVLGEFEKAEPCYKTALANNPPSIQTLKSAADFYLRSMKDPKTEMDRVQGLLQQILELRDSTREDIDFARPLIAYTLMIQPDYERRRRVLEELKLLDQAPLTGKSTLTDLRLQAQVLSTDPSRAARQKALELFGEVAKITRLTLEEQFARARLYETLGNQDKAYETFVKLLSEEDRLNTYHLDYFLNFLIDHKYPGAQVVPVLNVLKKVEPNTARTVALNARVLAANDKKDDAVELLITFADKYEKKPTLFVAAVLEQIKSLKLAEEWFKKWADESKAQAGQDKNQATIPLLNFYARHQQKDEAIKLFEEIAGGYRKQTAALIGLNILSSLDDCRIEDIQRIEKVIGNFSTDDVSGKMISAAFDNLRNNYTGAMKSYEAVLKSSDPVKFLAINNYAFLLAFHMNDDASALALIRSAQRELKSPNPSLMDTEAAILIHQKDFESAIKLLLDATVIRSSPTDFFHLAQAYELAKRPEAKKALAEAQRLGLSPARLHPLERAAYLEMVGKGQAK